MEKLLTAHHGFTKAFFLPKYDDQLQSARAAVNTEGPLPSLPVEVALV